MDIEVTVTTLWLSEDGRPTSASTGSGRLVLGWGEGTVICDDTPADRLEIISPVNGQRGVVRILFEPFDPYRRVDFPLTAGDRHRSRRMPWRWLRRSASPR